ncbi:unnamed protein product, partial [Adineta steineri]
MTDQIHEQNLTDGANTHSGLHHLHSISNPPLSIIHLYEQKLTGGTSTHSGLHHFKSPPYYEMYTLDLFEDI